MYAHQIFYNRKEEKKAKAIKGSNVNNDLTFEKYY
jgi:hypothetical protein